MANSFGFRSKILLLSFCVGAWWLKTFLEAPNQIDGAFELFAQARRRPTQPLGKSTGAYLRPKVLVSVSDFRDLPGYEPRVGYNLADWKSALGPELATKIDDVRTLVTVDCKGVNTGVKYTYTKKGNGPPQTFEQSVPKHICTVDIMDISDPSVSVTMETKTFEGADPPAQTTAKDENGKVVIYDPPGMSAMPLAIQYVTGLPRR